jgi:hypothetical protein
MDAEQSAGGFKCRAVKSRLMAFAKHDRFCAVALTKAISFGCVTDSGGAGVSAA